MFESHESLSHHKYLDEEDMAWNVNEWDFVNVSLGFCDVIRLAALVLGCCVKGKQRVACCGSVSAIKASFAAVRPTCLLDKSSVHRRIPQTLHYIHKVL